MYERRSIFRDPKKQIILAVLLAVIVFILLLGRQGVASQAVISNGYAYLSVGRHGGVRIINIQDPQQPVEVGYYNTPGTANRVSVVNNYLFVADGRSGMRVLEISDLGMPVVVGVLQVENADIQDVAVAGNHAYLAMGGAGLGVVDISNPTRPLLVGSVDTPGYAHRVAIVPSGSGSLFPGTRPSLVYVADGEAGLQVIDVQLPFSPRRVVVFEPPGDTRDVLITGPFALLAAGPGGLWLLNITNPVEPVEHSSVSTLKEAQAVALRGSDVFVADGDSGLRVVDFSNPTMPAVIATYRTPGKARHVAVDSRYIYISDDNQGLRILDAENPFDPGQTGLYETPGEASPRQVIGGLVSIFSGRWSNVTGKVWRTLGVIAFDLILFFIVLVFWLFVFAQFVLPVQALNERIQVAERILSYHLGRHGPAIFVENGSIRQSIQEKNRYGPGVAMLDTASGGVLRTAHAFSRAVGPGVIFTSPSEYFEGAVDLHRQVKSLGLPEGSNPFAPRDSNETGQEYDERQKQRYLTSALTRDGVEVVPIVTVIFNLISEPGQGKTLFGFNPVSVWRAVAREGINPDAPPDSDRRHVSWNWLPVYVAADLWREYLRKYTLNELFTFTTTAGDSGVEGTRGTAFNTIVDMIEARMTRPEVEDLDEKGQRTGIIRPSMEYGVLRDRGVRIISVGVSNLRFPQQVESQLVEQWKGTWLQRAQSDRAGVERLHAREKIEGQDLALKEFSAISSQSLYNCLQQNGDPGLNEAMEGLVQGTLKLALREANLQPRLTNQKSSLVELIEWIRKQ